MLIASVLITIGLYDQSLKIWRTRSAKDFTLSIIFALLFNEISWLNYGIAINEWPIIFLGCVNIPAAIIAVVGFIKYHRGEGK